MKLYAYLVETKVEDSWKPFGIAISFPGQAIRDLSSNEDTYFDVGETRLKRIKTIVDFVQYIPLTQFHALCQEYDGELVAFDDKDADVDSLFPSRNNY